MSFLVNVVIGCILYFVALTQVEPPAWAIGYIEQLKPTVKALDTAVRISDRPFPAQVMFLYAAISTVLLTMCNVYYAFFVKHIRQKLYRHSCEWLQQFGVALTPISDVAVTGRAC